jgi:hypothetical protein
MARRTGNICLKQFVATMKKNRGGRPDPADSARVYEEAPQAAHPQTRPEARAAGGVIGSGRKSKA